MISTCLCETQCAVLEQCWLTYHSTRIPAELAYERADIDFENERIGDEIRVRPVRRLNQMIAKFAQFSPDFMAQGRDAAEQAEREAL